MNENKFSEISKYIGNRNNNFSDVHTKEVKYLLECTKILNEIHFNYLTCDNPGKFINIKYQNILLLNQLLNINLEEYNRLFMNNSAKLEDYKTDIIIYESQLKCSINNGNHENKIIELLKGNDFYFVKYHFLTKEVKDSLNEEIQSYNNSNTSESEFKLNYCILFTIII